MQVVCYSRQSEFPPPFPVYRQVVSLILMFIDGKSVPRILSTPTCFSVATSLDSIGESHENPPMVYGKPFPWHGRQYILAIQMDFTQIKGQYLLLKSLILLRNIVEINLHFSGMRAHSSFGIGERIHEPPSRVFKKKKVFHPSIELKYV